MAIVQVSSDSGKTYNVRYSAPFGGLYVSTPESEAAMATIKNEVGDAAWKKGFTGTKGDSVSSRIRSRAKELGVTPIAITGRITNARIVVKQMDDGRQQAYLQVALADNESRTYLSVGAGSQGAQMLIRKLVSAQPGVDCELNMFATYGQNKSSGKWFAEHGASFKQGGAEVKGVDPRIALAPQVQAAEAALKAAGIDDKETLSKRRQKVTFDFHVALMDDVTKRFQAWYDEQHKSEHVPASHSGGEDAGSEAGSDAGHGYEGAGGYDEDNVPVF